MRLFALFGRELVVVHRVIVLIKPQHHRAFVGWVIGDKQIAAVTHENAGGVEKAVGLEHLLYGPVEPVHPALPVHVFDELTQGILITRGGPRVMVFVIESSAVQQNLLGLRVQMFGSDFRRQGLEQPAAAHDPFKGIKGIFQMQPQTEISRQNKPQRHILLFASRRHLLGQGR